MSITESTRKNLDTGQLDSLWTSIGWKSRGRKWEEVFSKSSYVYSLWNDTKLIGLGRIMEDGIMCMFYDIAVHPEYQKRGLGTRIMQNLIDQVKDKDYASIGLFAWEQNPANISFYEKFGFRKVGTGMELENYMTRE